MTILDTTPQPNFPSETLWVMSYKIISDLGILSSFFHTRAWEEALPLQLQPQCQPPHPCGWPVCKWDTQTALPGRVASPRRDRQELQSLRTYTGMRALSASPPIRDPASGSGPAEPGSRPTSLWAGIFWGKDTRTVVPLPWLPTRGG